MQQNIIYSSEFICISKNLDDFFIESFKKGMTLEQFNRLLQDHDEIKITSIMSIRNALINAPCSPAKFGEVKERINIELSDDELQAYVTLCVSEEEISGKGKADLFKEIMMKLLESGITFGVKKNVLLSKLCNNKRVLVAEGILPVNGEDSAIKMYELKEVKPEAKEDGNVDHYELNLINRVLAGEWLGERIDPKNGYAGKTVKGRIIQPVQGKHIPVYYDKKTVREEYRNGKTTYYALINGAVHYDGEKIGVSNYLELTGNVDYKTGNVDFDGFLTIKGSIEDGFSVSANNDIEILGDLGLGSVKEIVSKEGSVFIRGGIAGKNKAIIKSKRDVYTKFVSDTTIISEGSVHIGFYCLNSNIKAKEVILDSPRGQIIGGNIEADIKVVSSIIGSESEKRTVIIINGFDRNLLKEEYEQISSTIETLKQEMAKAKQEIALYSDTSDLSKSQIAEGEKIKMQYFELRERIKEYETDRKNIFNYLKTHGEGEVSVMKKIFPNTLLEIKGMTKEINRVIMGTSFYFQDKQIREL